MAYIDIDIEEHLDEVDTDVLVGELAERYNRLSGRKKDDMRTQIIEGLKIDPELAIADNIDEQAKRELIDEFIGKISYDKLKQALSSLI